MKHLSRAHLLKARVVYDEFTRFHGWPKIPLNFAISKGGENFLLLCKIFFDTKWTFPHPEYLSRFRTFALLISFLQNDFFKSSIASACHAVPIKVSYFKYAYQRLFHEFRGHKRSTITFKEKKIRFCHSINCMTKKYEIFQTNAKDWNYF